MLFRSKSAAFLTRQKSSQATGSDAALKAKLTDLHKDIKKQIEVEVSLVLLASVPQSVSAKLEQAISMATVHMTAGPGV